MRLLIPRTLHDAVVAHAVAEAPNECCGFLAGCVECDTGRATGVHRLVNELASPTAFRTEARSLFAAYRAMRAVGEEVLAVYHSHPTSAPVPSRRDLAENTYGPSVAWLIVGLAGPVPEVRVWWLTETVYTEAAWEVIEPPD